MAFEHYISAGGRRLRCGYTTGTCAALAAAGAARYLTEGRWPETVSLRTPKGWTVEVPLEARRTEGDRAVCGVRKDGGDDPDRTHGALIEAAVTLTEAPGVVIDGGAGVGRVTRPGLDQPVGAAAINRVPREMIARAVNEVLSSAGRDGGARVVISVPEGESIARQTFNPNLGILGGVSILGTSGVVEPMSERAIADTVRLEIRQAAAEGGTRLILTPGNYGLDFLRARGLDRLGIPVVRCSNLIGDALDEAALQGFREILLAGHIGKLVKLAGGIFHTHSRVADCRAELFCAHAALAGGDAALCRTLMDCPTADACLAALESAGLREKVMESLLAEIGRRLSARAGSGCLAGAVLFSNQYGLLGRTGEAETLLSRWREETERPGGTCSGADAGQMGTEQEEGVW